MFCHLKKWQLGKVIVFSFIKTKNPFEILSLSFDLRLAKMHLNVLNMNQFCKGL
jgi:hypothetical protein